MWKTLFWVAWYKALMLLVGWSNFKYDTINPINCIWNLSFWTFLKYLRIDSLSLGNSIKCIYCSCNFISCIHSWSYENDVYGKNNSSYFTIITPLLCDRIYCSQKHWEQETSIWSWLWWPSCPMATDHSINHWIRLTHYEWIWTWNAKLRTILTNFSNKHLLFIKSSS